MLFRSRFCTSERNLSKFSFDSGSIHFEEILSVPLGTLPLTPEPTAILTPGADADAADGDSGGDVLSMEPINVPSTVRASDTAAV